MPDIFHFAGHVHAALLQGVGDLLAGNGAEEAARAAALGGDLKGQLPELGGHGRGLLAQALFLFALSLVVHAHGVDVVHRGLLGQLAGKEEVPGIAVGDVDHLALLALTPNVLCQYHFHK